jgi:hypothetical protein
LFWNRRKKNIKAKGQEIETVEARHALPLPPPTRPQPQTRSGFLLPSPKPPMENFKKDKTMGNSRQKIDESEWQPYSRIRSKRTRKRAAIKDQDKRLIGLYKEEKALSKQKYALPMIDLKPPVQKGWKRYFVVREDVRRSRDGVFYENLLQKINTWQYSDTKDFKKRVKRFGKKTYEVRKQTVEEILLYQLPKKKFTEREFACFDLKTKLEKQGNKIVEKAYYEFREPWRYVLRVRPNIIDKIKAIDVELEQKIAELRNIVYDNHKNNGRLHQLRGWSGYHWRSEEKYKNPLGNISKQDIIAYFS